MFKLILRYRKIILFVAVSVIFTVFVKNPMMINSSFPKIYETLANYGEDKVSIDNNTHIYNNFSTKTMVPKDRCTLRLLRNPKQDSKAEQVKVKIENKIKYILEWKQSQLGDVFDINQLVINSVTKNNCDFTNCIITTDKKHLSDISLYDAILFNRKYDDIFSNKTELPITRSIKQKYVFVSTIPAQTNVVLDTKFDNFFNWTWTYRHDSDIVWKYFTIHHIISGEEIVPSLFMTWPNVSSVGINETLKKVMLTKSKAAAWFADNCMKKRIAYVNSVSKELENYGWRVDVFGKCGKKKCKSHNECMKQIKMKYYFYFALEDAIDDDYVTDKVLIALNNFAIPVVYGGAEYSRFLPPNSYLNARALGVKMLAKTINRLIRNMTEYYSYFEWINHYQFQRSEESKELCNICKALNKETMVYTSYYKDFRVWWNRKRWTELFDNILMMNGEIKFSKELVKRVIHLIL